MSSPAKAEEVSAAAWGVSLALSMMASAGLTVLKELWPSAKELLVAIGGHHWTGHALVLAVFYFATGAGLSALWKRSDSPPVGVGAAAWAVGISLAASSLLIGAAYAALFLLHH